MKSAQRRAATTATGSPTPAPEDDAGWSLRLAASLLSIVLLLELLAVSYMMISTALPSIATHFQTTQGAWLLTAFLLVGAMAAPLIGKLADMYGKRRMLLACVAIALVGSLVSAVASSYALMIVGRCLAGLLVPTLFLSYSLIRDVFPPRTVALAVSIATSGMGLIAIAAPFLTGWLLDGFGFRAIFWFFVVCLAVLGVLIQFTTPESGVRLRSRIDLVGAVLLGAGIAGILVAVSFGPSWGWTDAGTLAYLVGGIVLLGGWMVSARMLTEPLIDLDVLGKRPVLVTTIASGMVYGSSGLFTILLPMMVMTPAILGLGYGFGVDAEGFALYQVPIGAAVVLGGLLVGTLVGRNAKPRPLLVAGLVLNAVAFALIAQFHTTTAVVMIVCAVFGFGMGMGYASIPNLLIEAVPPQLQASSASMVGVAQSVFPAILPVVAFSIMNNSHIVTFPAEIQATLQGAVFYDDAGFQVAFWIGAVFALVGAAVAFALPRRIEQVAAPSAPRTTHDGDELVAAG
ncbi:MFS transporter [Rhodococcus sp. HNM0569]|uniref:MFS transporter n=1 Tax=Rhodococcus sp. HNM0569 TaxID=2716340 RepID=UPI00146C27AA|nr:MFS transporter [Rhodococcus sp. HNM0569]NLU84268.1 MFS transporter [Rhodococcus sp. HNM0569]